MNKKGCFTKIIIFIIIVFVLYKIGFYILNMRFEDIDEDYMLGLWVGKIAISEKINGYKITYLHNIALYFNENNQLGYSAFTYDADLNTDNDYYGGSISDKLRNNLINAIKISTSKNAGSWKVKNSRLFLNIGNEEYKSKGKEKKLAIFSIKNLYLIDNNDEVFKFSGNFFKFTDKDGKRIKHNNPAYDWIVKNIY